MTRSTIDQRIDAIEADQKDIRAELQSTNAKLDAITQTLDKLAQKIMASGGTLADSESGGEGGTTDSQNSHNPRSVTAPLTLPAFEGADPIGWLARANQQFEIHQTRPELKVASAMVAMEGPALYWFSWTRSRKPGIAWEEFSQALVARFDTRFKGSTFERLADVKQTGSMDDYVNLFVQLASQVPGLSDAHYLGYFMKGLRDTIRSSLRTLRPIDLEAAMELARDIEEDLAVQSGGRSEWGYDNQQCRSSNYTKVGGFSGLSSTPVTGNQGAAGSTTSSRSPGSTSGSGSAMTGQSENRSRFTRLSPQEFADLRAKGLCFRCKKPYTPRHECPLKQLRVMVVEEDEELDLNQTESFIPPEEVEQLGEQKEKQAAASSLQPWGQGCFGGG
ncbi:unnamed protein product [Cuscuta epithymum]|uniref:Retrotransposon gag domain-containing protein n=1 Tax=Cuscuta epithymum TaxID=186058 RepID=A0AAV0GL02_9ASTE|nr:unnamed protein product [Cuscuta epithymum]